MPGALMSTAYRLLFLVGLCAVAAAQRPNVVLVMADDQGWGDVGYQAHPTLKTPHLDAMAASGVRFDRWYAGAPVCSPTRGTCLTGRHHLRYGIPTANAGHLPKSEPNLAAILKQAGYRTGHFGKWHLGTLTKTIKDSNRGGTAKGRKHYAPPWDRGFDVCFSTEAKVPTFDPMKTPPSWAGGVGKNAKTGSPYGTRYWTGPDQSVQDEALAAKDDSHLIMDRATRFISDSVGADKPFLAIIWFHAPHLPVVASEGDQEPYRSETRDQHRHYLGCITAMDRAVGWLRAHLRQLKVADETMVWFCADNGPEGRNKAPGSSGGLRGRKRDLYEGGIRVPGLMEWPGQLKQARVIAAPCSTLDYLPTVLSATGVPLPKGAPPLDGVDLMPLLSGAMTTRPRPIPFAFGGRAALVEDRWKIVRPAKTKPFALYDISADPSESTDRSETHPLVKTRMVAAWRQFEASLPSR
ncbi:MAG: N-acetylgalactosamine 6-sulfate sulfatase [Planctomycetes bacterium]|nr:N-acetylgalactosamine 6-sulfate sulfatase [Planctomycetota bacterium]